MVRRAHHDINCNPPDNTVLRNPAYKHLVGNYSIHSAQTVHIHRYHRSHNMFPPLLHVCTPYSAPQEIVFRKQQQHIDPVRIDVELARMSRRQQETRLCMNLRIVRRIAPGSVRRFWSLPFRRLHMVRRTSQRVHSPHRPDRNDICKTDYRDLFLSAYKIHCYRSVANRMIRRAMIFLPPWTALSVIHRWEQKEQLARVKLVVIAD